MRKLILKCGLSPGDIVMLTAAVRDLHRCYPGRFLTDARTSCPELWEHNPHLTPLREGEPGVETIECAYPLIDQCNAVPFHCLQGFIDFFNDRLELAVKLSSFRGDIHLSPLEQAWCSQVYELVGDDIPFWVVAAGGKYDITIKWWATERYQQIVDHFRGTIQFVQAGHEGHYHPKLRGAIDLRGKTNLRQLVRLIYHSQGVLCGVTSLMHLAAAVERKPGQVGNRPCVVVAGGREPVHWEAYPDHQFIHTTGALRCCAEGGCWKDRVVPLGDGDSRDKRGRLCADVVNGLPRCMDMVSADEVIRRIELYFRGGATAFLRPNQALAACRGVAKTARNQYDRAALNLHNARIACECYIERITAYPDYFRDRGVVIAGGGVKYFTAAWVCINMLRRLGCRLPIQLWYLGNRELDQDMSALVAPLQVECIDATAIRKKYPVRLLGGWQLKPYAMLHCPFEQVLLLDADNVPVANPDYLFETPQFQDTGAVFWPDFGHNAKAVPVWRSCAVRRPEGPEFESGQVLVDKRRCWRALNLCLWFNENSDFYYEYLYGDKETFHLAWEKLKQPYALVPTGIYRLEGTMCQHDFSGRRIFQHRNTDKWNLFLHNKRVKGFWHDEECRQYVTQLQALWDGRSRPFSTAFALPGMGTGANERGRTAIVKACMISCAEREDVRRATLGNLAATDWGEEPAFVQVDDGNGKGRRERQTRTMRLALKRSLELEADYVLFLEDDLDFNRHLRHNLEQWVPLRARRITLASLYNPDRRPLACDIRRHFMVVDGHAIYGSQAFLLSPRSIAYILEHWHEVPGMQDIRISRLARRLKQPIYYHAPSLVQHVGRESMWGGAFHQAPDFDADWRAEGA